MDKIKEWFNSLASALGSVTTIVGVAVMLAGGWVIFWTWVKNWDWVQKGLMIFIAVCLLFILILSVYAWWRKTQIYKIPSLLFKLDEIMRVYVDGYGIHFLTM